MIKKRTQNNKEYIIEFSFEKKKLHQTDYIKKYEVMVFKFGHF